MWNYILSEPIELNETYTVTIWGKLGEGKTHFGAFIGNNGTNPLVESMTEIREGVYSGSGKMVQWWNEETQKPLADKLQIYAMPGNVTDITNTITKIKMEHGVVSNPVWTPAPQDITSLYARVTELEKLKTI